MLRFGQQAIAMVVRDLDLKNMQHLASLFSRVIVAEGQWVSLALCAAAIILVCPASHQPTGRSPVTEFDQLMHNVSISLLTSNSYHTALCL